MPLTAGPRPARVPLSFAQQRLWDLHQLDPGYPAFHERRAARIRGAADVGILQAALADVIARHESLRSVFRADSADGVPYQQILEPAEISAQIVPEPCPAAELAGRLAELATRAFDLAAGPLLRVRLLRIVPGDQEYVLAMVMHRAVADGASFQLLVRDLVHAYAARHHGREPQWAPLPVQYADYALWQRAVVGDVVEEGPLARRADYWRSVLQDMPAQIALPYDGPRPARATNRGGSVEIPVDDELYRGMLRLARQHDATAFMVWQAGVAALLEGLGAGTRIPLLTPVTERADDKTAGLIGPFTDELVLCVDSSGDPSFGELVTRVRAVAVSGYAHRGVPVAYLADKLRPGRPFACQVMADQLVTGDYQAPPSIPGLSMAAEPWPDPSAGPDLDFDFGEQDSRARAIAILLYNADLFTESRAQALVSRLVRLLGAGVSDPARPLSVVAKMIESPQEES